MKRTSKAASLAIAVLLAACSENSVVAPSAPAASQPAEYEYGGGATADLSPTDTLKFSITIDPSRQTYYDLGAGNSLTFPAGSLCDPYKSTYGDKEWDKPCTTAKYPLTVKVAAWMDQKGHPRVDFTPNVRFVPSTDPAKWVRITFADLQASLDPAFNILYCSSPHSDCKDEAKKDPTLVTYRDPITHKLSRRVKHFSGYNVAAGDGGSDYSSLNVGAPGAFTALAVLTPRPTTLVSMSTVADRSKRVVLFESQASAAKLSGYILASG